MLDLVLKLIDKLIDLSKRKEEVNRATFTNFVQPLLQTFEAVHADYIQSLTQYRARFDDLRFKMNLEHPIFDELRFDSLKTQHLRTKLMDFRIDTSPEKLRPLVFEIDGYLRGLVGSSAGFDLVDKLTYAPNEVTEDFVKQRVYSEFESFGRFQAYREPESGASPFLAFLDARSSL